MEDTSQPTIPGLPVISDPVLSVELHILSSLLSQPTTPSATIALVLSSMPKSNSAARLASLSQHISSVLSVCLGIKATLPASYPPQILASFLRMTSLLLDTSSQIDLSQVQKYSEAFFSFLTCLADEPLWILKAVEFLRQNESLVQMEGLPEAMLHSVAKYLDPKLFHNLVSAAVFQDIDHESFSTNSMQKIKDLLSIFANVVALFGKNAGQAANEQSKLIVRSILLLIETPLSTVFLDRFQTGLSRNSKDLLRRSNLLDTMLIDSFHFLQEELKLQKDFESDTRQLALKIIKERTSVYQNVSDCNIMRVILHYIENSTKASELFEDLRTTITFQRVLEVLLLSKDSEDLKYSFHFLQHTVNYQKDKELRKVLSECVNLLSTLDSFGKYLIEPQWISVVGQLLVYLNTQDAQKTTHLDMFWMFKILATKAMKHDNPLVVKFIITNMLEQDLNLNIYKDLLFEILIPLMDNGKLYEDVGLSPDIHPKLADYLRDFFSNAGAKYSEVLSDNYQLLAERISSVDSFNGKSCVWHIFGGLYRSGKVRATLFDLKTLEKIVAKAIDIAQNYPAYRKSLYTDDFVCFASMLPASYDVWRVTSKYFLAESLQETFFHSDTASTRNKYARYVSASHPELWTQIISTLHSHFSQLSTQVKTPTEDFKLYCWTLKLLRDIRSQLSPSQQNDIAGLSVTINKHLSEIYETVEELANSPYANPNELSNLAVVSMRILLEYLTEPETLFAEDTVHLSAVLKGVLACASQPVDVREHLEPMLSDIRKAIHHDNPKQVDTVNKCLKTALQQLVSFLEQPYTKQDEISEQTKTRQADSLLMIVNQLTAWKIECECDTPSADILSLMAKAHMLVNQRNTVRMDHQHKSVFVLFQEYLSKEVFNNKELRESYVSDCAIFSLVTKHNRYALNRISKEVLLPQFSKSNDKLPKFFKVMIDTIEKLRNGPLAYYIFESFMCFELSSLSQDEANVLSEQLIKVCEIDNAAFRLRKISTLVCKFVVSQPKHISKITKLIDFVLLKEEARPRDASLLVDVREFMTDHGMFPELASEVATLNAYNSFPRILVTAALERVAAKFDTYDTDTQQAVDEYFLGLYERFFFSYFGEEINRKGTKPFDEKHKILIRKLQSVLVLTRHVRNRRLVITQAPQIRCVPSGGGWPRSLNTRSVSTCSQQ